MILRVNFAWTHIISATVAEWAWLHAYLSFSTQTHTGKEKKCPLLTGHFFPTGLFPRLAREARASGLAVEAILRPCNARYTPFLPSDGMVLRPHQERAFAALRGAPAPRGVIQHGTGTGKGSLISYLCGAYRHENVCVVVPSRRLAVEMEARILKVTGEAPGVLGAGRKDLNQRVMVVVQNSLKGLKDSFFQRFGVLLWDEVHGLSTDANLHAAMRFTNAGVRVGFSATFADRADGKTVFIVAAFGDVLDRYTPEEAAKDGVIAEAKLRMPRIFHPHHSVDGGYTEWERRAIQDNEVRNRAIVRLVEASLRPALVFVRLQDHTEILAKMLQGSGISALSLHGELGPDEVNRRMAQLVGGKVEVLVSAPILRQGADIPTLRTVVNASAMKAVIDTIQKVGRGSRKSESKTEFAVIDLWDQGCGCSAKKGAYVHASCRWLEDHTAQRIKAYEKYGYKIRPY